MTKADAGRTESGQALVEFAAASLMFFAIIFGTLDLGRVIFQYSQLTNMVREGARMTKANNPTRAEIKDIMIEKYGPGLDLTVDDITIGDETELGQTVEVSISYQFDLITADFLGLGDEFPKPYVARARVVIE